MLPRTILLLYVSVGLGHQKAAFAIKASLNQADPLLRTVCLDLLELWPPGIGSSISRLYRMFIRTAPGIWTYLYDRGGVKQKISGLLAAIHKLCQRRVRLLLEEISPSAVVCTQAFPCSLVGAFKTSAKKTLPLVAVPTDYTVHTYWLHEEVDLYLVPSEESRLRLIQQGVEPERLRVVGIPVHPRFNRPLFRVGLKKKYGLSVSVPIILLMGGGEGSISLEQLILALDRKQEKFQMAAVSGRNLNLHAHLRSLQSTLAHPLRVFGFTDAVDELMEIADLIVTKPGGLTTAEALVKRLPMVLIDPLPGQEELNARFLQDQGVAIRAGDCWQAAAIIAQMLNGGGKMPLMEESIKSLRKPLAARSAARMILGLAHA